MSTATIRALSGYSEPQHLDAKTTAVLIIDLQNEYVAGADYTGKLAVPDATTVLSNCNRLVQYADHKNLPVFWTRQLGPSGAPVFAEGTKGAEFHKDMKITQRHSVITKATPSAFVGTDLDKQLKRLNITRLVVGGLPTHLSVDGTVRDAVPLGYDVIIAEDACATRDLDDHEGKVLGHDALHRSTLTALGDVYATVCPTQRIMSMPIA
ncbi:cysteine hydrolase family protein [Nocardia sp. NPDC057030]|uniref:cysteine hydrolase family protein n=1 Tax=unclassified Nocardia TaxID=2637762 RepID=UPI0036333850